MFYKEKKMSVRNYTLPDTLDLSGANTITWTAPFDLIVKINECFQHITTVVAGDAVIDIKEGSAVKGTFPIADAAADNTSTKGVPSGAMPDFHVAAGTAINFTVSNTATSGVSRVTLAYAPAVQ
jgi:hypothetical protein